jgi:hypothetical protein
MADPITTVGQWAANQSSLAELTAQFELFDSLNADGTYDSELAHLMELYRVQVIRGLDTAHPYRDYIIRTKAWAMARAFFSGRWSDKEYFRYRDYRGLIWVNDLYRERFTQERLQADFERGNDLDLSYWMESVVCFYGNRLLNLADAGDRPETATNHWTYERLVGLTCKLEGDKWFDEMFVARTSVQFCAFVVSGFFLRSAEEHEDFLRRSGELLYELNELPTINNSSTPLPEW